MWLKFENCPYLIPMYYDALGGLVPDLVGIPRHQAAVPAGEPPADPLTQGHQIQIRQKLHLQFQ